MSPASKGKLRRSSLFNENKHFARQRLGAVGRGRGGNIGRHRPSLAHGITRTDSHHSVDDDAETPEATAENLLMHYRRASLQKHHVVRHTDNPLSMNALEAAPEEMTDKQRIIDLERRVKELETVVASMAEMLTNHAPISEPSTPF